MPKFRYKVPVQVLGAHVNYFVEAETPEAARAQFKKLQADREKYQDMVTMAEVVCEDWVVGFFQVNASDFQQVGG